MLFRSGYTSWLRPYLTETEFHKLRNGATSSGRILRHIGATELHGFQFRYIYFLDPTARERLTVPVLPFKEIDKRGAGMYKGKRRVQSCAGSETLDTPATHAGEGGSLPTPALHS